MKGLHKTEEFPLQQSYSKEEQIERYWKCNYTEGESQLSYWILLPKDVKPLEIKKKELEGLNLYNIGRYVSTDANFAMLEVNVYYEHYEYEMNASDWLAKKLSMMGEDVLHYRKIEGKSTGTYIDVLTSKKVTEDKTVISRFTVLKDYDMLYSGANYFMVKASCFENDYWERVKDILQITNNWDLINKTEWNMAENLQPFLYDVGDSRYEFYYPVSWSLFRNSKDLDSTAEPIRFLLRHEKEGKIVAGITVLLYTSTGQGRFEKITSDIMHRVNSQPEVECTIEKETIENWKNPSLKRLTYMQGELKDLTNETKAFLMSYLADSNAGIFYIEYIGSRPNLQNNNWEEGKRCLELILSSFNNLNFDKR